MRNVDLHIPDACALNDLRAFLHYAVYKDNTLVRQTGRPFDHLF